MMKKLIILLVLALNLMASSDKEELVKFFKENATHINYGDISKVDLNINDLDSIVEISFLDKNITTLPNNLYLLSKLEDLDLSGTKIKTLPNEFIKIKSLKNLYLSNMELIKIPSIIFEMINLTYLDLSHNYLKELPSEIFNLKNLNTLYLNDNNLYALAENFFNLFLDKEEIFIDISNNKLTFLDKSMCNIKEFIKFNFHGNFFDELPSCVQKYQDREWILSSTGIYGNELYSVGIETLKKMGWSIGDSVNINYTKKSDRVIKFDAILGEDINVTEYFWEFGDGNYSTEKSPIYKYPIFATFNVTLKLNGGEFRTSKIIDTHKVVLKFKEGWNLIATPTIDDINTSIFESVWGYQDGEWIEPKYLKPLNGYFVKLKDSFEHEHEGSSYRFERFPLYRYIWYLVGSGEKLSKISKNYTIYVYRNKRWILNPSEINQGEGFWINYGDFDAKDKLAYFLNDNATLINLDDGKRVMATKDNLKDIKEIEFNSFGLGVSNSDKELPSEMKYLINLEKLSISVPTLEKLPKEIYNLTTLKSLKINNSSALTISNEIENLQNLEIFEFAYNKKDYIPNEVFKLKNLKRLTIIDTNLSEVPKEIGDLKKLEYLNLMFNNLKSLPSEIGELKKLKELYLDGNRLISLPKEIDGLESLKGLSLSNNGLTTLPKEIANLKNLIWINVDNNQIEEIPSEIEDLIVTLPSLNDRINR